MKNRKFVLSLFIFLQTCYVNISYSQIWSELGPTDEPIEDGGFWATGIGVTSCLRFGANYSSTNPKLYCGSAAGGLWVSLNDGGLWENMNTDELQNLGVGDVAPDRNDPDILYLATGYGFANFNNFNHVADPFNHFSDGIYKTTNATSKSNNKYNCSWNKIGNWYKGTTTATQLLSDFWTYPSLKTVHRLMIDPQNSNVLFALIDKGFGGANDSSFLYRSIDAGANWFRQLELKGDAMIDLEFTPNNSSVLYLSTLTKILRSNDNGISWINVNSMFADNNTISLDMKVVTRPTTYSRIEIAVCQADPDKVFINYFYADPLYANEWYYDLYVSSNGGASFTNLQTNIKFTNYGGAGGRAGFAVSQISSDFVVIGENACDVSLDGGITIINGAMSAYTGYNNINSNHADVHFVNFSPINNNKVFICHDGGVSSAILNPLLVGINRFQTTKIYNGMGIRRSMCLGSSQQNQNIFVESGWDCGHNYVDLNMTNPYKTQEGGDGTINCIDYMDDQTYGFGDVYNNYFFLHYNGKIFRNDYGLVNFHPTDHNFIYYFSPSNGGFYKQDLRLISGNSSYTPFVTSAPLSTGNHFNSFTICQSNPNVIYAIRTNLGDWSFPSEVFKSSDGGSTFNSIDIPSSNLVKGNSAIEVVVNPYNENQAFICYASTTCKVMMTNDGGSTWQNFSSGLPTDALCRSILFVPGTSGIVFLGTHKGVYFIDINSNSIWQKIGTMLPNANVTKLNYLPKFNKLRVSTSGRGVWELELDKCLAVNNDGVSENQAVPITLTSDITWEMPVRLKTDLIIPLGITLTIKGEVYMSPNAKIKLYGKLILDGAKITRGCDNAMWHGITCYGNSTLNQNSNAQCLIICKNNSEISYSKVGIESLNGAIVRISNSHFINNRRSVYFGQYNTVPLQSWVKNTRFLCDGVLPDQNYIGLGCAGFITLWDNEGVIIEDNTFENSAPSGTFVDQNRGYGIYSEDANYRVSKGIISGTYLDPYACNAPNGPGNTFIGLTKGIYANAYSTLRSVIILSNKFSNCQWSILCNSTDQSKIYNNHIEINDLIDPIHYDINNCTTCSNGSQQMAHMAPNEIIGIGVDESYSFFIDQNTIERKTDISNNINAIYVNSSHNNASGNLINPKIYNNLVSYTGNSITALPIIGTLILNNNPDLEIQCNTYIKLKYDWFVDLNGGILNNQGNFNTVIKNTWTPCSYAINNIQCTAGGIPFTYFSNPSDAPLCCPNVIVSTPAISPPLCLATNICEYFPAPAPIINLDPPLSPNSPNRNPSVIKINPNPATDYTTVSYTIVESETSPYYFEIINSLGILVYKNKVETNIGELTIRLDGLTNGIYTLKVFNKQKTVTQQNIVIMK